MSFMEKRCVCKSFKLNAELESLNLNLKVYIRSIVQFWLKNKLIFS